MTRIDDRDRLPRPRPTLAAAVVPALVAAVVTSGIVSALTPDGNLVVTLVPGLAVGLVIYGIARWRLRRRDAR